LRIDATYAIDFAVASETTVGTPQVQDATIPIVLTPHLVSKLKGTRSLAMVIQWLKSRRYLPVEGRDYAIKEVVARVGRWSIEWYGIKPLLVCPYA
jgi:hypothetical protein